MTDLKGDMKKVRQIEAELRFVIAEREPAHVMSAMINTLSRTIIAQSPDPSKALEATIEHLRELCDLRSKGPAD